MHIVYTASDEVNRTLARGMARRFGVALTVRHPGNAPILGPFDALLHDVDAVPPDQRSEFLTRVVRGLRGLPMAVHGYSLTERQAEALCRRGVAVAQRLHLDLFRTLCRSVRWRLEIVPPDDALTDLTWVNLVD